MYKLIFLSSILKISAENNKIRSLWEINEHKFKLGRSEQKITGSFEIFQPNKRTGEMFPVKFQYYEDYQANKDKLDILSQAVKYDKPLLLVHGTHDETVLLKEAKRINEIIPQSILVEIENANHVFGAYHPYENEKFPKHLEEVIEETIEFFDL